MDDYDDFPWWSPFAVVAVCAAVVALIYEQKSEPKPENCAPIAISATTPDGQASTRRGLRCDLWSDE